MAQFAYTALDQNDIFTRGTAVGRSAKDVLAQLEKSGLMVVSVKPERQAKTWSIEYLFTPITSQDRIFFSRNTLTMVEAGIGLDQAVKTTAEQTSNRAFRTVLLDICKRLQSGQLFHVALSSYPRFFSPFYVNMVKVGETSGKLEGTLKYLLEQQEKDYSLRNKAKSAMIYPAIIVTVLIIMVTLMLTIVIPRVSEVLLSYNAKLPWSTRGLLWASSLLLHWGWLILICLVAAGFFLFRFVRTPRGARWWGRVLLNIPRLRGLIREYNLAMVVRSLHSLTQSGVSIDRSLELTSKVISNAWYRDSLSRAHELVRKGVPLSEILRGYPKLYPPLSVRMIEVGEKSGKLEYMLGRLSHFYEESVERALLNLSSIIEPVLLLAIGLAVAFVALSVMLPIWSLSSAIS